MKQTDDLITKAEAAKRLNVTRQMVNKYTKQGMPVDVSGLVPWIKAESWHTKYICSHRSGSFNHRQRTKARNGKPPALTSFQAGGMHLANVLRNPVVIL